MVQHELYSTDQVRSDLTLDIIINTYFSFLVLLTGGMQGTVVYDTGSWKPMVPSNPRATSQARKQGEERIQGAEASSRVDRVDIDIDVQSSINRKMKKILDIATDRVGNFFSGRPASRPVNQHSQHPGRRPQPPRAHPQQHPNQHQQQQQHHHRQQRQHRAQHQQVGVVAPPPPAVRLQHGGVRPSVRMVKPHLHTNSAVKNVAPAVPDVRLAKDLEARRSKMIKQLSSVKPSPAQDMKTVEQPSSETREELSDPILLDFEDTETRSQVHRSAFIDPAELDALQSARSDQDGGDHQGDHHDDEHHDNSTQSEDPHGAEQFCVDISEYLDLKWVIKDSEECHVTFTRSETDLKIYLKIKFTQFCSVNVRQCPRMFVST